MGGGYNGKDPKFVRELFLLNQQGWTSLVKIFGIF